MPLRVADALAKPVTLLFGDGAQDREYQLADAVAADIAAKIDEVQADLVLLQLFQRFERIGGRAERAIQFRGNNNIARLEHRQQPLTFRTIRERHRAGHAGLDENSATCQPWRASLCEIQDFRTKLSTLKNLTLFCA